MFLYSFIRFGAPEELKRIFLMASLSGCANAYLVALINGVASLTAAAKPVTFQHVLLYILAFAIYYVSNRAALETANQAIERLLCELRLRMLDKIRRAELLAVDQLGRGELTNKLIQETNHLSQSFPTIVGTVSQLVLLVFCLLYIAYLSLVAFIIVVGASVGSVYLFAQVRTNLDGQIREVHLREAQLVDSLGHIIDGFKELKVNRKKSEAIFESFRDVAYRVETVVVGIGGAWVFLMQFANIYLYGLLGILCFVLPQHVHGFNTILFKISAASLFCVGPIAQAVSVAPMFVKANMGLEQIFALEARLDASLQNGAEPSQQSFQEFSNIRFRSISFSYRDDQERPLFTCGPWDMELSRGETVFVVGGNGAGKSTVLKLLTGLYPPDSGTVEIDGQVLDGPALREMRELFSIIFADFHLFDRLYGLEGVETEKVQGLIDRMELSGKVQFEDGRFTNLNLSTGQRKRLALIAALLENRPICVFDEWAADQDSHFRQIFYTEILPDLKARGKTVVAVTHDDRYWGVADRVVKMDLGQMVNGPAPPDGAPQREAPAHPTEKGADKL